MGLLNGWGVVLCLGGGYLILRDGQATGGIFRGGPGGFFGGSGDVFAAGGSAGVGGDVGDDLELAEREVWGIATAVWGVSADVSGADTAVGDDRMTWAKIAEAVLMTALIVVAVVGVTLIVLVVVDTIRDMRKPTA